MAGFKQGVGVWSPELKVEAGKAAMSWKARRRRRKARRKGLQHGVCSPAPLPCLHHHHHLLLHFPTSFGSPQSTPLPRGQPASATFPGRGGVPLGSPPLSFPTLLCKTPTDSRKEGCPASPTAGEMWGIVMKGRDCLHSTTLSSAGPSAWQESKAARTGQDMVPTAAVELSSCIWVEAYTRPTAQ